MTNAEAFRLVAMLKAAYPRQSLDEDTPRLYALMLRDLPVADGESAVLRLIATSKFFPTVAEIRAEATADSSDRTGPEAWNDVLREIALKGWAGLPHFDDALVAEAVRVLGWREICLSSNSVADRARFCEVFGALQQRGHAQRQIGNSAPPRRAYREIPGQDVQRVLKARGE